MEEKFGVSPLVTFQVSHHFPLNHDCSRKGKGKILRGSFAFFAVSCLGSSKNLNQMRRGCCFSDFEKVYIIAIYNYYGHSI